VLTLRGSQSAAKVTQGVRVSFSVRALLNGAPKAGVVVQLERRIGTGSWTVLRRGTSGAGGLLSVALPADRTSELRFRSGSTTTAQMRLVVTAR
jgi:hypothetical protein